MARALQPGHTRHDTTHAHAPVCPVRCECCCVAPSCLPSKLSAWRTRRRESTCACTLSRRGTRALLPCRAPPTCQERALKLGAAAAAPARAHARWGGPLLRSPGAREAESVIRRLDPFNRRIEAIAGFAHVGAGPQESRCALDISRLPLRECVELGSGCGRGLGCKLRTVSISRPARQIGLTSVLRRPVKLLAACRGGRRRQTPALMI